MICHHVSKIAKPLTVHHKPLNLVNYLWCNCCLSQYRWYVLSFGVFSPQKGKVSGSFSRPAQQSGVNLLISAHVPPPRPDTVLFVRKALVQFSLCVPAALCSVFLFFLQFHLTEILHQHLDTIDIHVLFLSREVSRTESQTTCFQSLKSPVFISMQEDASRSCKSHRCRFSSSLQS